MRIILWAAASALLVGAALALQLVGVSPRWAAVWVIVFAAGALLAVTIMGLERVPARVPTWRPRAGGPAARLASTDWMTAVVLNSYGVIFATGSVGRFAPLLCLAWISSYLVRPGRG